MPLTRTANGDAVFPAGLGYDNAKRLSYHNDFSNFQGDPADQNPFRNPVTNRGPMEGRPPGEFFAHQRWNEFFPKVGYVMSWGQCVPGTRFHPNFPDQNPNSVWCYGTGNFARGLMPPPLIKGRYGEPILTRIYNNTPVDRAQNGGFGRNETQLHFHNAHNGAESDGATGAHHFPGTFYDYRWSTTLARRDKINTDGTDKRAAGPDDGTGIVKVPGDWRELQGTMWIHDHRFFFTAENVYKGNLGMVNYYRGRDRGHETITSGTNLRLPSGTRLGWGNVDFDVNLVISDGATDQAGQYFFDIFTTDGFLGDLPLVNFAYAPYFEVLPRKYRFRILNGSMSRFLKLALSYNGAPVPFKFIANDGNFVVNPITLTQLDEQGIAERYDIVVDFSIFPVGSRIQLVNLLTMRDDGRGPQEALSLAQALAGRPDDPVVGRMMEFRVVNSLPSVDAPGVTLTVANSCGPNDKSQVPAVLTEQIPIVAPVRTRVVEFGRSGPGDSRDPVTGQCTPDCPEGMPFPWTIRVNGEDCALLQRQPHLAAGPQAGRGRALDLHQRRRRLGPPDPPALRGRHHHGPGRRPDPGHRAARPQGRVAPAAVRQGHVPGAVRRVRRLLRQPLPQHRARGLRHADAAPAPVGGRAAGGGDAHRQPDARRRVLHDAGDPARGRSETAPVRDRHRRQRERAELRRDCGERVCRRVPGALRRFGSVIESTRHPGRSGASGTRATLRAGISAGLDTLRRSRIASLRSASGMTCGARG